MYFDDLPVGYSFETAERELAEAEIIAFASQWDPQFFHTDPEAAKSSPYGGLIASGYHTLLTAFTLELASNVWTEASMGSPGMDALRWLRPVRPGDRLRVRVEVTETRPSRSKPDRGITRFAHTVLNQHGEAVMTYETMVILARRPDASAAS
ncbi:MaoC family dehydratase [Limibaculum sp. M0105]|uniref:MaoC family dehydratase n=1 Tax=Thermohalobaculum xanthum TaxID=2753746 RepID=A0A8J7M7L9_9RHOB|nr:MaoC family dehydratase [Thermohalobaculum xanthum]MBK0399700.1 MaoC family dehydratase [Thermohalobaculum xanthum]